MHFPKDPRRGYDAAYFRQLTAEECTVAWKSGRKVKKFANPSGRRNEALDIRCMAIAARELRNPDFIALAEQARQSEMDFTDENLTPGGDPNARRAESAGSGEVPASAAPAADGSQTPALGEPSPEGPVFDPATGKISRTPVEQLTPADVQAAPANTYKPIGQPPKPVPSRPRRNFATSW